MNNLFNRNECYFVVQQRVSGNTIEYMPMMLNGTSFTIASSFDFATSFNDLEKANKNLELLNTMSKLNETEDNISFIVVKRSVEIEFM